MNFKRKRPETSRITETLDNTLVSQIKSIAELQNIEFSDAFRRCLEIGAAFQRNNYLLTSREMKVRTLDNMLSQVYPLLYKKYLHDGVNVPIIDKIVQLWYDMKPYFVQEVSEETSEIIGMQVHEILKYVHSNFGSEFKLIKTLIINTPRTKTAKALFNLSANCVPQKPITTFNPETQICREKFKNGKVTKGKYQKDDGTFGEAEIDFPPIS